MTDRELMQQALEALESVLCDPEGRCCIRGTAADRAVVDGALTALRERLAQPEADWDWRHPKAQALIGAKARLEIKLRLIEQLVEDPNFETTASDMEYWEPLHDKLQERLAQPEQYQRPQMRRATREEKIDRPGVYWVPVEEEPVANNWSVFNSCVEVWSGLSWADAIVELSPERLERGWSAVCVINKGNLPAYTTPLDRMAENARKLGLDYEPVQEPGLEPVKDKSWHHPECEGECIACLIQKVVQDAYGTQGLDYLLRHVTTPPRCEWVGLTEEELDQTVDEEDWYNDPNEFARAIEAKLKEKNA